MDNFTHYWLAQKNLASQGQSSISQSTPKQNNKCVHAWEKYKKLDFAYHDLRREYLSLREENLNIIKVTKDWLVKMRGVRLKCLELKKMFQSTAEFSNITLNRAEEIMGEQFYGPEEIKNAFGFAVDIEKIPAIPYSSAELRKAKELGERLVLRIGQDAKKKAMTMKSLNDLALTRMSKGEGKLLSTSNWGTEYWYKNEEFYKKISLKTEWKLVGGKLLKDSTSKKYAEQTKVLRDYLKSVGSLTAEEESECSDENLANIGYDVKKLAALEVNQKHRRNPVEVLYDWFLHFKKFKNRDYLKYNHELTNIVTSDGNLASIGGFISHDGAMVQSLNYDIYGDLLGVVSVR